MTRRAAAARRMVIAVLLCLSNGCGVSTESRPRPTPQDQIPPSLSNPPLSPSTTDHVGDAAFTVYLIDGGRLRPVPRAAPGGITPAARLDALRAGPTSDEAAAGLGSALNEETSIRISRVTDGTATVDLPPALAALVGSDQVLSLAQLVFTLTEDPAISEVIFTVDGEPVAAPVGNGALIGRAVGRGDFPALG